MKYLFIFPLLIFVSCSDSSLQKQLESTQNELQAAQATIENLQEQIEPEGDLVHVVFFKLKPDADQAVLLAEVKKMEGIKEIMDLEIGPFENLGDARALSEYSMMMQMSFADAAAYQTYQKHPLHLALKENVKPLMAGPPATYDFIKK